MSHGFHLILNLFPPINTNRTSLWVCCGADCAISHRLWRLVGGHLDTRAGSRCCPPWPPSTRRYSGCLDKVRADPYGTVVQKLLNFTYDISTSATCVVCVVLYCIVSHNCVTLCNKLNCRSLCHTLYPHPHTKAHSAPLNPSPPIGILTSSRGLKGQRGRDASGIVNLTIRLRSEMSDVTQAIRGDENLFLHYHLADS